MSRGLGALQRRILDAMKDRPLVSARALATEFLAEDHQGVIAAMAPRARSMDRAVRRALRGLEARKLVVDIGRMPRSPYSRRAVQGYCTPEYAAEIEELAPLAQEFYAKLPGALARLQKRLGGR